jgi:macrolide transport system ATP-binding/permease protein
VSLWRFFRRSKRDAELAHELDSHLAHEIDDNLARGMSPEEARRQAYLKLGNPLRIRDTVWETNRIAWLEDTWRDFRYAARTLAKTPGFTIVAVLVMALGIGANTAIYSFLDSLLLRSLPVSDPASLVVLNWHAKSSLLGDSVMQSMSGSTYDDSGQGSTAGIFPYPAFELFQHDGAQNNDAVFSDVFAYCHTREVRSMNVAINGQAEVASGELVSGNYFQGLAVQPAAGRLIIPDDDRTGAAAVAVVSHAFSEKHFGRAGTAAGQSILINNLSFVVVGVTPAEFFGVDPATVPEIYIPMHTNLLLGTGDTFGFRPADYLDNNYYWVEIMARLRPGVSLAQAQAAWAPRFQQWVATTASNDEQRANLPALALKQGATGLDTLRRKFSKPLYVLMTLVALILAIACSNVANLLLARAATRKREIALRMSVGAGRLRVIRQLLTESVLLASLGGALGVLMAVWGIRFLTLLLGGGQGNATVHADLNWHVLGVAAVLSIFTGVLFGLAPALQSTRFDLASTLKEIRSSQSRARDSSSRIRFARVGISGIGVSRIGVSQVLLVGQVALSLLMLVAAGLFVRTLSNLQSVELGFNRENLLLFKLNARQSGHRDPEITDFYAHLRDRLAAIPGVRDASLAEDSLINGENLLPISLPGLPTSPETRFITVGPDFMTTMQIPILAGRDIEARDHAGTQRVAVISERFARINFPGQNPLGRHVILWKRSDEKAIERDMEIVGVSKDARYGNLKREILPVVYLPYDQGFPQPNQMTYILRTSGDPLSYVNSVREEVRQADGRIAISDVRTQTGEISEHLHQEIMLADLCSAFAVLAVTIACVGLYGTMSYTVARRTGEIGIRMALGAQRGAVVRAVLGEVLILVAVGLAISVPAALGTSRFVQSLLFGMKPNDPLALTVAVAILLGAALLAGYVPARRASRIDPMAALRHE